jgi:hypothetical protein
MEQGSDSISLTGLKRDTIDKFYTKKEVSKKCVKLFIDIINPNSKDIIIEPSAGNGSFLEYLSNIPFLKNIEAYDIEPENEKIVKKDYLTYIPTKTKKDNLSKIHIIGNPPFGRQSSMAKKFIKKSCEFCDSLSFILPKSFKKDSMIKTFPLNFHLIYTEDLEENSFVINNNIEYNVPCVFQIWVKKQEERIVKENILPINYEFIKQESLISEDKIISFRRVGVNAGTISKENLLEKSPQSHYFIKFSEDFNLDKFIEKYNDIKEELLNKSENTVGPKSISKSELNELFSKIL